MPEALTKWRFLGFAHDRSVRSGFLEGPRRHRQGPDGAAQPAAVPARGRHASSSPSRCPTRPTSPQTRQGAADLQRGARTDQPADKLLGNTKPEQAFDIPAKESRSFAWRITRAGRLRLPDLQGRRRDRPTCPTARKGYLPVLSRRILVTESLPLPIRGPATKKFEFTKLLKSGSSKTLAAPEPHGADGVEPGLVRGAGAALPDGIPARMHRADLQPALRQRPGPPHRQLATRRSAASSTSGRTRPRSTARWRRTRTSRR